MTDPEPTQSPKVRIRIDIDGRTVEDRVVSPRPPHQPRKPNRWQCAVLHVLAISSSALLAGALFLSRGGLAIAAFAVFFFGLALSLDWHGL